MIQYALYALTAIFTVQSALQPAAPLPQPQEKVTQEEARQAQEAADLFVNRLIETGDLGSVIDELFGANFFQRRIKHQKNLIQRQNASSEIFFAPGLEYKPDLLNNATEEDWRRLYIATYNFLYQGVIIVFNKTAKDLLSGNTPNEVKIENIYPAKISVLFNSHPILKNFIRMKEKSAPISNLEEMRSATALLEQGLRLLREELGNGQLKPSGDSKRLFELMKQTDAFKPFAEVFEKEFYGFPAGTRALLIQTPVMLSLTLVNVNGKYRIVWVESSPGI
jgi:hypothetical protein